MIRQRRNEIEARVLLNEAEIDRFVVAEGVQRATQGTLLHLARLVLAGRVRWRQFGCDLVVAGMTRDFFDEVFFLFDVDAPRWNSETIFPNTLEAEPGQDANDFFRRDCQRR